MTPYRFLSRITMLLAGVGSSIALFAQTSCLTAEQVAKAKVVQSAYQAGSLKTALLSRQLKSLMRADQICAEKNGVCQLDFDPLYDSQDPEVERIQYHCQKDQVVAKLFSTANKPQSIAFSLVRENGAWKIDDLQYATDRRLKQILSNPTH